MKLLNSTLTLLVLAAAVGSAVPRAGLSDCTESNNDATACGSPHSYDVFRCAKLSWEWVKRCSDPDVPCVNGACISKQPECVEGEKQCLAVLNRGYDGINICKNGKWITLYKCHCIDFPSSHCTPAVPRSQPAITETTTHEPETTIASLESCNNEGEQRCVTAGGHEISDRLEVCKRYFWTLLRDCAGWPCLVDEESPYCYRHVSGLAFRRD